MVRPKQKWTNKVACTSPHCAHYGRSTLPETCPHHELFPHENLLIDVDHLQSTLDRFRSDLSLRRTLWGQLKISPLFSPHTKSARYINNKDYLLSKCLACNNQKAMWLASWASFNMSRIFRTHNIAKFIKRFPLFSKYARASFIIIFIISVWGAAFGNMIIMK